MQNTTSSLHVSPSLVGFVPSENFDRMEKEMPKTEMVGGLEPSLLHLVHDHHQTSLRLREQTEKAKKDAQRIAIRVSDLLVDTVNGGVQESFINEKRIELEIRALAATIGRYTRQTNQWLAASHAINSALKEFQFHTFSLLGFPYRNRVHENFENWMKAMDYDYRNINAAIRSFIKRGCFLRVLNRLVFLLLWTVLESKS